jgi:C-terminal processing protease CtpA/Prc
MNLSKQIAVAGALVMTAGFMPTGVAHGQSRESGYSVLNALQLGRGSRIGVTVQDVEESDKKDVKSGVVVESVDAGGPADKAGIKSGDAIVEFDGDRVRSVRQFQRLVQESAAGRSVGIAILRGGQRVTVNLTPEQWGIGDDFGYHVLESPTIVRPAIPPTPPAAPRTPRPGPTPPAPPAPPGFEWFSGDGSLTIVSGRGQLGIATEAISGQLAEYFGVKEGALVKSVQDDSAGAKAGIKAGDIITSINGSKVYEPSDVSRTVNRLDEGAEFTVEIIRDHKPQTLKGKVAASQRRRSGVKTHTN